MWLTETLRDGESLVYKRLVSAGSPDMNVDGSGVAVHFDYVVPACRYFRLERLNLVLLDAGIGYGEFGGLGVELTNGVLLRLFGDDGVTVLQDFMDGGIKKNADFVLLAGSGPSSHIYPGQDLIPVGFEVSEAGGKMKPGQLLRLTVQDDLTGLTYFQGMVHGVIY